MRTYIISLILLLCVGIQLQSCKDCEPTPGTINTLLFEFYDYDSLIQNQNRIATIRAYEAISATTTDSVFYSTVDSASNYSFTLSNLTNSTTYTFLDSLGTIDTLQVDYTVQVVVDGPDCGIRQVYNDISVSKSTFTLVNIVKNKLELNDELHVEVFH